MDGILPVYNRLLIVDCHLSVVSVIGGVLSPLLPLAIRH